MSTEKKGVKDKYIFTSTIMYGIFFGIFLYIILFVILPGYQEVEEKKSQVFSLVNTYNKVKTQGLSYENFNSLKDSSKITKSVYLDNLLKDIDSKFYNANFTNKKGGDYDKFISEKTKEVNSKKSDKDFISKVDAYKKILPSYVESGIDDKGVITDFKFLTYIESIVQTFNLKTSSKTITLGNVNTLEDYNSTPQASGNSQIKAKNLDSTLFYIPYYFSVSGTKNNILDFIYFLENVGTLKYDKESNSLSVLTDNVIGKNLDGFGDSNGNILENPILDIENISFSKYPDSSSLKTDPNMSFVDFLRSTQGSENVSLDIKVRFYVKGLPNYKMQEYLEKITSSIASSKEIINGELSTLNVGQQNIVNNEKIKKLEYLNHLLSEVDKDIESLNRQKTNLYPQYDKMMSILKILENTEKTLKSMGK